MVIVVDKWLHSFRRNWFIEDLITIYYNNSVIIISVICKEESKIQTDMRIQKKLESEFHWIDDK